ncbi:MAG: DUF4124 domain-containing protein [Candidatus Binatia bacterium]
MRSPAPPAIGLFLLCALGSGVVEGQQIYRWTDAEGKAHFGNVPAPGARQVERKGRERSQVEIDCAAAADRQCRKDVKLLNALLDDRVPTTAVRDCLAEYTANCVSRAEVLAGSGPESHYTLETTRLPFNPGAGDRFVCRVFALGRRQRASVEVRDSGVVTKRDCYEDGCFLEYQPRRPGSAYCRVTTAASGLSIDAIVTRDGAIVASARQR